MINLECGVGEWYNYPANLTIIKSLDKEKRVF